jgi:hypothetical protein
MKIKRTDERGVKEMKKNREEVKNVTKQQKN